MVSGTLLDLIVFAVGAVLPTLEWSGGGFIDTLINEYTSFLGDPDLMGGISGALMSFEMPITTILQDVGLANAVIKKIGKKNFLGSLEKYATPLSLGMFLTRTVMYGSHSSPTLPVGNDVTDSIYNV